MNYTIRIGKEIDIQGVNEILDLVGWGVYQSDQWSAIMDKSTFMVTVLSDKKTVGFARTIDDTRMCMI